MKYSFPTVCGTYSFSLPLEHLGRGAGGEGRFRDGFNFFRLGLIPEWMITLPIILSRI